jgi:hypothetical protein
MLIALCSKHHAVLHISSVWIKQTSVSIIATYSMVPANHQLDNAYVSGLSDGLNFHGNELVRLQTILARSSPRTTAIHVVALKGPHELPRPSPRHPLGPLFTLLQYRASSYSEMMAYRFLHAQFS